jgi:hypothetical protein
MQLYTPCILSRALLESALDQNDKAMDIPELRCVSHRVHDNVAYGEIYDVQRVTYQYGDGGSPRSMDMVGRL